MLFGVALPIESGLPTTALGLVTLCLTMDYSFTYFHLNTLLHWLSFMPFPTTFVSRIYNSTVYRTMNDALASTIYRTINMTHTCTYLSILSLFEAQ